MNAAQVYLLIALVTLAIVVGWMVLVGRGRPRARPSALSAVAMVLVVAGIVFGERRVVGYSLIGMGALIAILDIVRRKARV